MQTVGKPTLVTCIMLFALGIVGLFIGVIFVLYDKPASAFMAGMASGTWLSIAALEAERRKGR